MALEQIAVGARTGYRLRSGAGPADADVLIGGTGTKFVTNINAQKWATLVLPGGEAWLNINFPVAITNQTPTWDGNVVSLDVGDIRHRWYGTITNELEYEFVLLKRPPHASFILTIDFAPGLEFWFQPPLANLDADGSTWEPFDGGIGTRPANVSGSYAVYHSKAHNQYETGKFCHIYRPHLTDALGNETWADITIDQAAKTLTISVSAQWLRDATYPVTVDPTIGFASVGGSTASYYSTSACRANVDATQLYAANTGDTVTQAHIYGKLYSDGSASAALGVYTVSGGAPVTLTGAATSIAITTTTAGWWDSDAVSIALSNGVTYCVGIDFWAGGPQDLVFYYDSSGTRSRDTATTLPATWTEQSQDSYRHSAYVTVEASGAAYVPYPFSRGARGGLQAHSGGLQ